MAVTSGEDPIVALAGLYTIYAVMSTDTRMPLWAWSLICGQDFRTPTNVWPPGIFPKLVFAHVFNQLLLELVRV